MRFVQVTGATLRNVAFLTGLLLSSFCAFAQNNFWSDIREQAIQTNGERRIIPNIYRTYTLNFEAMRQFLSTAPDEADVNNGFSEGIPLSLPFPDGRIVRFRIWESSIMHPDLQAQFPQIRTYAGQGIDQPHMRIRFDQTHMGFHAMVFGTENGAVFIDPYAYGDNDHYIIYYKKDFSKRDGSVFTCEVEEPFAPEIEIPGANTEQRAAGCGTFRVYDLALAATGEYCNFHGSNTTNNDKSFAIAAMTTSMNRVNGVFEFEMGLRMSFVANNADIVYLNPATDPYTNGTPNTMINENQTNCDAVIGATNYDIGHVFGTNSGGLASLRSPCTANRARGVTGSGAPVGDPFDIDYVAHEMGHQYGGNHTQYNNCNRVGAAAMEPGSASTIMGYAGICSPNVQSNSDAYFHTKSLREMGAFIAGATGNSCPTKTTSGNSQPTLAALSDKSIPISTPFVLTGVGGDPNGDPITYCWEQVDSLVGSTQTQPPVSTNTSGPMFRSFDPDASPSRYFPRLSDLVNNNNYDWEELSSVARTLRFRCTVRDVRIGGACTTERNINLTTVATAGPFVVTIPNTNVSWPGNSNQTVTWDVANTTAAPVSCANVDISLSTDGGFTYTTLLSNTPNDGSESVLLPVLTSTTARMMVKCSNNVFFDISNVNFTITTPLPVELSDFQAQEVKDGIALNWVTLSEKNNQGFHLERSVGNANNFEAITFVASKGNGLSRQNYQYLDREVKPGQAYYYRLRQTDFDAQISHSNVLIVVTAGARDALLVFPNPGSDFVRLLLPASAAEQTLRVQCWSVNGQLMFEQNTFSGQELDLRELPEGVYNFHVTGERQTWNTSVIKR
jgi:hypothetical protein